MDPELVQKAKDLQRLKAVAQKLHPNDLVKLHFLCVGLMTEQELREMTAYSLLYTIFDRRTITGVVEALTRIRRKDLLKYVTEDSNSAQTTYSVLNTTTFDRFRVLLLYMADHMSDDEDLSELKKVVETKIPKNSLCQVKTLLSFFDLLLHNCILDPSKPETLQNVFHLFASEHWFIKIQTEYVEAAIEEGRGVRHVDAAAIEGTRRTQQVDASAIERTRGTQQDPKTVAADALEEVRRGAEAVIDEAKKRSQEVADAVVTETKRRTQEVAEAVIEQAKSRTQKVAEAVIEQAKSRTQKVAADAIEKTKKHSQQVAAGVIAEAIRRTTRELKRDMTGIDEETFSETDPAIISDDSTTQIKSLFTPYPDIISDDSTTQEKLPFTLDVEPASDESTAREDFPSPPQFEEKRYKKTTFQADSDNSSDESTTHVKRPFTSDFDDSSDDADKRVLSPVSDPNDKPDDTNAKGNLPSMPDSTTTFGIETLVMEDESEFINVFHSSEEEEPPGASPAEVVDSKPTLDYKPKPGDHLKESLPAILEEYPMTRKPRGFAVIFNIEEFHKIPGDPTSIDLDNRLGSSKDVEALRKAFENLHFIVDRHDNTTIGNIICITDGYASRDHSELDCFVVCILTHGSEGKLYDTNGRPFQFETIFKKFYADKCRSLSGKPKMFFIQACQGSQDHDGRNLPVDAVLHRRTSNIIFREGKTNFFEGNSPADADFLVFFPARLGLPAFRNDNQGSWFIQSLAENLEKYGERCPLNDILNIVKREVSTRFVEDQDGKRYTQTPKDDSTLLKTVFFRPLGPP